MHFKNMTSTPSHLTRTCVLHSEVEPYAVLLVASVRSNEQVVLVLIDVLDAAKVTYSKTFEMFIQFKENVK